MPKVCYVERKFDPKSRALVDRSNAIIAEYTAQGFVLTLRQLYYQLVSRDIIPNRQKEGNYSFNSLGEYRANGK